MSADQGQAVCTREHFDVGDPSVDPCANEIRRGAETVKLEPKVMKVLCFLSSRAIKPGYADAHALPA